VNCADPLSATERFPEAFVVPEPITTLALLWSVPVVL
jgi:hypothetical protein